MSRRAGGKVASSGRESRVERAKKHGGCGRRNGPDASSSDVSGPSTLSSALTEAVCPAERSCAESGSYPTDTSSGLLSLSLISSWLTRMNTNVMIEPTQIMAAPTMNA
jgi:hypothetical protein